MIDISSSTPQKPQELQGNPNAYSLLAALPVIAALIGLALLESGVAEVLDLALN